MHLTRSRKSARDLLFIKSIEELGLSVPCNYPITDTFFHHNNIYSSQIDYILCFNDSGVISNVTIDEQSPTNLSTHVPVTAELTFSLNRAVCCSDECMPPSSKIKWDKCDKKLFQRLVTEKLENFDMNSGESTNDQIIKLSNILRTCAEGSTTEKPRNTKRKKQKT